ncbi:MAG: UTP--glucose-1-phosphate uridylyltransferase [Candidatus Moraniibacteriota bacterium]|nr:MAG: UTP--glucose-1-phosphate uridylyltransferase [Candidatus Moranbacteria bacterium]
MSKKPIRKAIVAVAGSGTRLLPATKSMPKEMLPIVDKPAIQLIVEELVAAGIEDIILVTKWDKKPLEDHFDRSWALESDLEKAGKEEKLQEVRRIADLANFIYVRQKGPYGNGTPLLSAASLVDDEPFVYAFGDDLVKSKTSFTKQMVEEYEKYQTPIVGVQRVSPDEVHKYGIVELKEGTNEMKSIVEKPEPQNAPSQLAQFGRFILDQDIINSLRETSLGKGNELWLTDAIERYLLSGKIVRVKEIMDGKWLTTGDPLSYVMANLEYAMDRDDLRIPIEKFIQKQIHNREKGR